MKLRGISPVIATVIILAVTIAIAIAVVGWVMGLFRSSAKGSVQLQILPNSTMTVGSNGSATLQLSVKNKGSSTAQITQVTVEGASSVTCNDLPRTVAPGDVNTITCTVDGVTPGVTYTVYVYTADGSTFPGQVVAS
jgi:flagellin-like protein